MKVIDSLVNCNQYFNEMKKYDNIVCFGAGSKGRQSVEILKKFGINPIAYCDNNEELWGTMNDGIKIMGYRDIRSTFDEYVILITCTLKNAMEIYNDLIANEEKNPIYFFSNPYKAENKILTYEEIILNQNSIQESYDLLADEQSKKIFIEFMNWKVTGDMSKVVRFTEGNWLEVFSSDLLPHKKDYVYVDVGVYTGDSLVRFLAFSGGRYSRIIGYEPDEVNYTEASRMIELCRLENITLEKKGLWSEKTKKEFFSIGDGETIYESSNFFRDAHNTVKNQLLDKVNNSVSNFVWVDTLDNLLLNEINEADNLLVKIDALASEGPIIYGMEKIIVKCKPIIVMEYGTHSEHTMDMIPYLHKLNPEYKFYIRQIKLTGNSRSILYVL